MEITFRLNDICNLQCDYCHWCSYKNYELQNIKSTLDNIFIYLQKRRIFEFDLYFHGGEPTFHPNIIEILEYIKTLNIKYKIKSIIEVQTNFTLKTSLYQKILKLVDFISVSFHYNEMIKTNTLSQFLKNLKLLTEQNLLNFDIMLEKVDDVKKFHQFILDEIYSTAKKATNSEMIYGFCHYSETNTTRTQHKEFYEKYNLTENVYKYDNMRNPKNTNELFEEGLDCSGMVCEVMDKYLTINGNGDVFKCGIHMTNHLKYLQDKTYCGEHLPECNLLTKQGVSTLLIKANIKTICPYTYCGGDFYAKKYYKDD